jgi:uncharacterized protein YaaW (UPF0174 family)
MDELTEALELATDEELHYCADILFKRKFNPIDYFTIPKVVELQSWERFELIQAIAQRFRFLAADGFTILKGKANQISYRQVLERVCQHLKIKYSKAQTVAQIEAELFLSLIQKSWQKLSPQEQRQLQESMQTALTESDLQKTLPPSRDSINLVLKGSSAIAVSAVIEPAIMGFLARQFALSSNIAKYGIASVAARYAAVRTVFSFVAPALWGVFFADLGWRAIATNYSRVIPVIFVLAQIRLLRDL